MNVIKLQFSPRRDRAAPVVCFVDLQVEYIAGGRELALNDREPWTSNCRLLLAAVRSRKLSIAHFRQLRRETLFNAATSFSAWIDEFKPRPFEMVFERPKPSCYSAPEFEKYMQGLDDPMLVLIGLTGAGACLATAVDAFHRGHRCVFVSDASATAPLEELSESMSQRVVSDLLRSFGEVISTSRAVDWLTGIEQRVEK